jgi:hypothetical protein
MARQASLKTFIRVRILPTGSILFIIRTMRKVASGMQDMPAGLTLRLDRAEAKVTRARQLQRIWIALKGMAGGIGVAELDAELDGTLGTFQEVLRRAAKRLRNAGHKQLAAELLGVLFPLGAAEVIRMPIEREVEEARDILAIVQDAKWAELLRTVGLTVYVEQLEELIVQIDAVLQAERGQPTRWDEVEAALAEAHESLLRLTAYVAGTWSEEEDIATRERLLAPIRAQEERVAEAQRAGRSVIDVNPDTGELEADAAPADAPAPA